MTYKKFSELVRKHKGWIENNAAYFPSVWHKEQFELEAAGK